MVPLSTSHASASIVLGKEAAHPSANQHRQNYIAPLVREHEVNFGLCPTVEAAVAGKQTSERHTFEPYRRRIAGLGGEYVGCEAQAHLIGKQGMRARRPGREDMSDPTHRLPSGVGDIRVDVSLPLHPACG
jgi:hypothetical protein